jgi:hydrogenase maturation protein HypF
VNACDDSVVQVIDKQVQVIRLARGYAPLTININPENEANFAHSPVLAVGAQQKNTIALGFDHCIMLSPHIGDLYSLEAQQYFHQTLATFKRLYAVTPSYIVHDKHPQYTPSQWACNYQQQHALPAAHCISVQHHYAHVLSVMAVNQHTDTVLGISFDGTGLGDDGVLWGSEVMLADIHGYRTLAHFSEFSLIGGEQAIKQPERILLALLFEHLSVEHILTLPINAIHHLGENTVRNLYTLWRNNRHCIPCRSVGRLFDALAVGLNLLEQNQYEGQAGMMIETAANLYLKRKTHPNTGHEINNNGAQTITLQRITTVQSGSSTITWNSSALITELVTAAHHTNNPLAESTPENAHIQQVCWHFMAQIAEQIDVISRDYRHIPMVFCGGVFQNKTLLNQCLTNAQFNQHPVLASQYVPINDGGIALGQLWYGLQRFMPKTSQTTPVTI